MIRPRFTRILWFFGQVLLHLLWWDILLPKLGLRGISKRTRPERLRQVAVRFRQLAVSMGGVMIKVGQFLSARLDVLPHEITDELAGLQDEVQAERYEDIRAVIEAEIGEPLEARFTDFEPQPLASASIGQVHRARLRNAEPGKEGLSVVVKVQRPNIKEIVDTDLAALRVVTGWIHRYPPVKRRVNTPALMEEFSRSLYEEIDYLAEGKNGEMFAASFSNRPDIRVPDVIWSHTTRRVLTMEEIRAIKITDYPALDAAGVNRAEIANRLFNTYLKQIFEDRFFHADPHPGNLFILPEENGADEPGAGETGWKLVFVDFGMTGKVSANLLTGLREILIAVGTRDVPRLIRSYQTLEILLPGADTDLLEKATTSVFERFWGKSTSEIVGMGHEEAVAFAREFGDLLYELPFQVPENLILLGRSMGILSGICTGLDSEFNVFVSIMPYARQLVEAESGGRNVWVGEIVDILQIIAGLPRRTDAVLQRIERGRLEVQVPELRTQGRRVERGLHRLAGAVLFATLFTASTQLYLAGETEPALGCLAGAVLALIWMLTAR